MTENSLKTIAIIDPEETIASLPASIPSFPGSSLSIVNESKAGRILKSLREKMPDLAICLPETKGCIKSLIRRAPCSILYIINRAAIYRAFGSITVQAAFSENGEKAVACGTALNNIGGGSLRIVREVSLPGLAIASWDQGSQGMLSEERKAVQEEEKKRLQLFIKELGQEGTKARLSIVYGREGSAALEYAIKMKSDLYITPAPEESQGFFERLFSNSYAILSRDPGCSILVVR